MPKRLTAFMMLCALAPLPVAQAEFFRVEKQHDKWFLLDPAGKTFYMRGLNHYGDGTHMPWNLAQTHGTAAVWRKSLPATPFG